MCDYMSKKEIQIFTLVGILSSLLSFLTMLLVQLNSGFTVFGGVLSQIAFFYMLFLVAKDLKNNYGKPVWIIYLYCCASLLLALLRVTRFIPVSDNFYNIIVVTLMFVLGIYFLSTVYRSFGIAFMIIRLIPILASLALIFNLPVEFMRYLFYIYYSQGLVPLFLIYIVRTKEKITGSDIDSIGSELVHNADDIKRQ